VRVAQIPKSLGHERLWQIIWKCDDVLRHREEPIGIEADLEQSTLVELAAPSTAPDPLKTRKADYFSPVNFVE
jgi:hypothetical protein